MLDGCNVWRSWGHINEQVLKFDDMIAGLNKRSDKIASASECFKMQ